jgi:hypothetical protein
VAQQFLLRLQGSCVIEEECGFERGVVGKEKFQTVREIDPVALP